MSPPGVARLNSDDDDDDDANGSDATAEEKSFPAAAAAAAAEVVGDLVGVGGLGVARDGRSGASEGEGDGGGKNEVAG